MKTQLLILQNDSGYVRVTSHGTGRQAIFCGNDLDGEIWCQVGDSLFHRPIKEGNTLLLPACGDVLVAIEKAGKILCDTHSSAVRWEHLIAQERAKEQPATAPEPASEPLASADEEPVLPPEASPLAEIVEVQVEAPRAPTSIEERLAGYPPVPPLEEALPDTHFVRVEEDGSDYVLGIWYRDGLPHLLGYGVKGQKDRPLEGGELISTREGDYWIVWAPC